MMRRILPVMLGVVATPPILLHSEHAAAQASQEPGSGGEPDETTTAMSETRTQAVKQQRQGDVVAALETYEALLDERQAQLSGGQRQELRTWILEIRYQISTLVITGAEAGTRVFVDNKSVGTLPFTKPLRVKAGQRKVRLTKPGFETIEAQVDARGGTEVHVHQPQRPVKATGDVAVQVKLPSGSALGPNEKLTLIVDQRPVGNLPWRGPLVPGQHSINLEGERFFAGEQVVQVPPGGVVDLVLEAQIRTAQLTVNARSGRILLNGKPVAEKLFSGRVAPGRYVVRVERPGFEPFATTIELRPGQSLEVPVPMANRDTSPDIPPLSNERGPGASGLYLDILGLAMFASKSTHEWHERCPEVTDPSTGEPLNLSCDTRRPIGGALGARLGVSLGGSFGVEGFAIAAGDWSKASISGLNLSGVPSYLRDMHVGRVGGVFGAGIRLATPPGGLRFALGLGGGLAVRRVYSNVSSLDGSATRYAAPAVIADLRLFLGSSTLIGIFAWAEFSKTITVEPDLSGIPGASASNTQGLSALDALDEVTVFQGTQIFIGPSLAMHFGH
jgi:hypothetical protein